MFGREVDWLYHNRESAIAAKTWEEFCATQGRLGEVYRSYNWLEKHWETLKAHPETFVAHALKFPHARKVSDLFTGAYLCPHEMVPQGRGAHVPHPAGTVMISESGRSSGFCVTMRMGGTRGWNGETRTHYGSTFYITYVKVIPEIREMTSGVYGEFRVSSLEAIDREDGVLIISRRRNCIGSDWLALLDKGESLWGIYDDETRTRIEAEHEAIHQAWGD